jgi:hypothetical protein
LSDAIWAQKARCSIPERIPEIDAAFRSRRAPYCMTFF